MNMKDILRIVGLEKTGIRFPNSLDIPKGDVCIEWNSWTRVATMKDKDGMTVAIQYNVNDSSDLHTMLFAITYPQHVSMIKVFKKVMEDNNIPFEYKLIHGTPVLHTIDVDTFYYLVERDKFTSFSIEEEVLRGDGVPLCASSDRKLLEIFKRAVEKEYLS